MTQPIDLPGQYRTELQRVVESESFRHTDSLRRLLQFLGERSLAGSNDLKEYTIGVEAFHKPEDYNPQHDPTIRVLASKLRHKLDEYYGNEGMQNPVRMEIPRGHYELRFRLRPQADAVPELEALRSQIRRWRWVSLGLGVCLLLLLLVNLYWGSHLVRGKPAPPQPSDAWSPELEMIWQPFLRSDRPLLVSLGTPMFTKMSRSFFRNPRINEWSEAQQSDQIKLLQRSLQSEYAVPAYPYTGVGEATGAFILCRQLHSRKANLVLQRSNTLTWDDIRINNLVFLGSPKFNPQLKDLPAEEGFMIERGAIRNPRPRPGEPDAYRSEWSDDQMNLLEDYALIHRLPGLHGRGEIMVLASASTEATWAAVEYVIQPGYAKDLVQRVKLPSGKLPRNFQLILRVELKQQVPWKISYVTHRVLEHPWNGAQPAR